MTEKVRIGAADRNPEIDHRSRSHFLRHRSASAGALPNDPGMVDANFVRCDASMRCYNISNASAGSA
jgi:hypothetical protein